MGINFSKFIEEEKQKGAKEINLSRKWLAQVPHDISHLKDTLVILNLSHNGLENLPLEILQLSRLQTLDLSHNKFKAFPSVLFEMNKLEILNLSSNKIKRFPKSIGELINLKVLVLSKNYLVELPRYISDMNQLRVLRIDHNPLRMPPSSIIKRSKIISEEEWLYRLREWLSQNGIKTQANSSNFNNIYANRSVADMSSSSTGNRSSSQERILSNSNQLLADFRFSKRKNKDHVQKQSLSYRRKSDDILKQEYERYHHLLQLPWSSISSIPISSLLLIMSQVSKKTDIQNSNSNADKMFSSMAMLEDFIDSSVKTSFLSNDQYSFISAAVFLLHSIQLISPSNQLIADRYEQACCLCCELCGILDNQITESTFLKLDTEIAELSVQNVSSWIELAENLISILKYLVSVVYRFRQTQMIILPFHILSLIWKTVSIYLTLASYSLDRILQDHYSISDKIPDVSSVLPTECKPSDQKVSYNQHPINTNEMHHQKSLTTSDISSPLLTNDTISSNMKLNSAMFLPSVRRSFTQVPRMLDKPTSWKQVMEAQLSHKRASASAFNSIQFSKTSYIKNSQLTTQHHVHPRDRWLIRMQQYQHQDENRDGFENKTSTNCDSSAVPSSLTSNDAIVYRRLSLNDLELNNGSAFGINDRNSTLENDSGIPCEDNCISWVSKNENSKTTEGDFGT